jgi:ribonuclease D
MSGNHNADLNKTENPVLVYNRKNFAQLMTHLARQTRIAIDTESDSLYRYYPKVCLIQITAYTDSWTPDPALAINYLVDPLRIDDIRALELIFANPAIEKIMHAAENDIYMLKRGFGFTFQNIFDTQLAARILGWKRLGLAAILEEHFGVLSDKRMQRTDWGKRPLTPQQITYAQMDTHYLPALREILAGQLHAAGRWEEANEAFSQLSQLNFEERLENKRSMWQVKGARDLPSESLGVLAALWEWREREAQRRDRPPFKIMNDETLSKIAAQRPATMADFHRIKGLSPQAIHSYSQRLLEVVGKGLRHPPPVPPPSPLRLEQRLDSPTARRFDALRRWRTTIAHARGVSPDIVFTNETLVEIAQRDPRSEAELLNIPAIGPWKARTYGSDLLAMLRKA